jgi:hypothetical protein
MSATVHAGDIPTTLKSDWDYPPPRHGLAGSWDRLYWPRCHFSRAAYIAYTGFAICWRRGCLCPQPTTQLESVAICSCHSSGLRYCRRYRHQRHIGREALVPSARPGFVAAFWVCGAARGLHLPGGLAVLSPLPRVFRPPLDISRFVRTHRADSKPVLAEERRSVAAVRGDSSLTLWGHPYGCPTVVTSSRVCKEGSFSRRRPLKSGSLPASRSASRSAASCCNRPRPPDGRKGAWRSRH